MTEEVCCPLYIPRRFRHAHTRGGNSDGGLTETTTLCVCAVAYAPTFFALPLPQRITDVGTILFMGILGCGRMPVLGDRPYEVWQEGNRRRKHIQRRQEKREQWR